jgi:hypothetical protein
MNKDDVMVSLKEQLKIHIGILLEQGVRKQNIEIELLYYIKKLIYADR